MNISEMPVSRVSPDDGGHYWVGYYDKQPWSADGSRILSHRSSFCDRFPEAKETCEVGTIVDGRFESAGTTSAWNWQQGAHLRWNSVLGVEALMFNDFDDHGRLVSRWVSPAGEQLHTIDSPIYAVTPDGKAGITLSFARLRHMLPEYGYPGLVDEFIDDPAPEADGIWRVDLQTGERTMLVSIAQLARADDGDVDLCSKDSPHQHVNHIMIDPSGKRCCFLHRYDRDEGIHQSRLFTIGIDGSDLRLLIDGMVSHYDWMDTGHILAWAGRRKLLGSGNTSGGVSKQAIRMAKRTLKPIYYAMGKPRFLMNRVLGDSYMIFPDQDDQPSTNFAKGQLTCDGHNTFFHDESAANSGTWMVTDGYPDLRSRQPLFLWDMSNNLGYEIGRYPTPKELDGEVRVDLHPRFSPDGRIICIDSAMDGARGIYGVDVGSVIDHRTDGRGKE